MNENKIENENQDLVEIEKEYIEMIEKAEKQSKLTKEEYDKLYKETMESTEFMKLLNDIKIPDGKHVIFTDGDVQLIYENGEFFLVSALDSTSEKKKIKRKKAIDLNIEYFIKYQINPIIEARKKVISTKENEKIRSKSSRKVAKNIDLEKKEIKNTKKEEKEEKVIEEKIR